MNIFDDFGLREMVIGTAVLLGVYSGIVIIRLARLTRVRQTSAPWQADAAKFGEKVVKRGIEAELEELRSEIALLKEKVSLLEAARHVSPHYGEAVALAQKGLPPDQIAERCDISVAEAEMICALSRPPAQ